MPKTRGIVGVCFRPFLALAKETVQIFLNEISSKNEA
jgi:hypothetical protein